MSQTSSKPILLEDVSVTKTYGTLGNKFKLLPHTANLGLDKDILAIQLQYNFIDKWLKSLNFFDLKKVFDIVDHEILMNVKDWFAID